MAYDLDDGEHWLDALSRRQIAAQKKLLMRLNRAELRVLADHYKMPASLVRWCFEPHDYRHGGKEEICEEIAQIMVGE
jgi:hypothetical protein